MTLRELLDAAAPGPWAEDTELCSISTADGRALVLGEWPRDDEDARAQQRATTRLIALAPDLARRVADLSEWAEQARAELELDHSLGQCGLEDCSTCALLARLDEIRGQA